MENINLEQWSKIRAQGKGKYIFFQWVLCAAIPVAIIMPIIRGLIVGEGLQYFFSSEFIGNILVFLILCIVIALIAGNVKWKKNERKYLSKE